jgi:site-specific recombinase XerD
MLVQGVHPKVVADMLGHAKVGLTLDVYSHVLPSLQAEAAGKVEALLASEDHAKAGGF